MFKNKNFFAPKPNAGLSDNDLRKNFNNEKEFNTILNLTSEDDSPKKFES